MANYTPKPYLVEHQFKGDKGTKHNLPPISTKYPPNVDAVLRSLPNRNDYIRDAVLNYEPDPFTEKPKVALGIGHRQKPISTKFPADLHNFLQAFPNRSEYIRDAVIDKLHKDGLLPSKALGNRNPKPHRNTRYAGNSESSDLRGKRSVRF